MSDLIAVTSARRRSTEASGKPVAGYVRAHPDCLDHVIVAWP